MTAESSVDDDVVPAAPTAAPRRRVLVVAAAATACIAGTVAFMLLIAYGQITDYPTYDVPYASAFAVWCGVFTALCLAGIVVAVVSSLAQRARERRGR